MKNDPNGTEMGDRIDEPIAAVSKTAVVLCGIVLLATVAISRSDLGKGFLFGSIFSLLNFWLMKRGLLRRLGMSRNRAGIEAFLFILLRYALLSIPLITATQLDGINTLAVCVGIFNVQLAILLYYLGWMRLPRKGISI